MDRTEIHETLHRAGVEVCYRPHEMIDQLADLAALDKLTVGAVKRITVRHGIPQIPAARIVTALTGKGVEL